MRSREGPWEEAREAFDWARSEHNTPEVLEGLATACFFLHDAVRVLEPPAREMQQLFGVVHGNPEAMDRFVQMNAGTISRAEFMSPESVNAIMAAAADAGRQRAR